MASSELPEYSAEEVADHRLKDSAWTVYQGEVLDVTKFLAEHPGGEIPLLEVAGEDCTEKFVAVGHSKDAEEKAKQYVIGKLKGSSTEESKAKKCCRCCRLKLPELTQKQRDIALYICLPTAAVVASLIIAYRFANRN
uniref:Cytochrome b5 heme-binding domain-containing protein n=1 Tax=Syphacia muris TaxID=451379 RepID=A0A0N5AZZ5_9BILA